MVIYRSTAHKNAVAGRARAYKEKVQAMKALASQGDPDAHYWLATAYSPRRGTSDKGLAENPVLAVSHLRQAAEGGHALAMFELAKLHADVDANLVKYDLVKALELIVEAAEWDLSRARHILARRYLNEGSLRTLLEDDEKGRRARWPVSGSDPAQEFIDEYRAQRSRQKTPIPEKGEALHPVKRTPFSVERTGWFDKNVTPDLPGVYERQMSTKAGQKVFYAFWTGKHWTEHREHPDELSADLKAGVLGRSGKQRLPWRGLSANPEARYITYVDPPGALRPGFAFGGYVAHKEYASPLVKTIHVAKATLSPDGNYLTACGYYVRDAEGLRLWSSTQQIKVVDGYQPALCPVCRKIAFSEPKAETTGA
jgi:hypothetical protein